MRKQPACKKRVPTLLWVYLHEVRVKLGVLDICWLNDANGIEKKRCFRVTLFCLAPESSGIMVNLDVLLQVSQQLVSVKMLGEVELAFLAFLALPASSDEKFLVILDELAAGEQVEAHLVEQLAIHCLLQQLVE